MRSRWLTQAILVALALAWGGCTLIYGTDEHSGGDAGSDARADAGADAGSDAGSDAGVDAGSDAGTDAGTDAGSCVDADGDGFAASACGGTDCNDQNPTVYPGAPPICGDSAVQSCPGDLPIHPLTLLGAAVISQGRLPLTSLRQGGEYLPQVGLGVVPGGGSSYGQAVVIIGNDTDTASVYSPARVDLSLLDLSATEKALSFVGVGGATVPASPRVTSLWARESADGARVVTALGAAGEGIYSGVFDIISGSSSLRFEASPLLVDGVTAAPDGSGIRYGWRTVVADPDAGSVSARFTTQLFLPGMTSGGSPFDPTTPPAAAPLDTVTTADGRIMMHDGAGTAWFAGAEGGFDGPDTLGGQAGAATMLHVTSDKYLVSYGTSSALNFQLWDCAMGCVTMSSDPPSVAGGPLGADAHDSLVLPGGRLAVLTVSRYADGDLMRLHLLNATGAIFDPADPIVLLDTRATDGSAILDARLGLVEAGAATSLVAVVARGPSRGGPATAIELTGLRACTEN